MEPSLSYDPNIVVRSSQGEARYGARVVIEPATGAMQADHAEVPPTADVERATLRAVNGRWLLDAAPESRLSINAVPLGGARLVIAGDVVTIAGSQLLVEEASPQTLALRRFELEGTDTLPPVSDSVQALAPPAEDLDIDMGDVPKIDGVIAPRSSPRAPLSGWNYAAWVMAALLLGVLVVFMLLKPVEIDLKPADARVKSMSGFSWQSASSLFVFPGDHVLRAERQGYEPLQVRLNVGGPLPATALIHLVKLPGKLKVDSGGVKAEISADGAKVGQVPGVVDVPAGDRTLTFKAPRYLDHVERLTILGGGEKQDLKIALKPNFGVVTVSSVPAGAAIEVDGQPAGVTPAKVDMDSGIRRVQLTAPGLRPWTSSIVITAGQPANIGPVTLGLADAHVTVRSVPSGAQVTTGGSFRGITPVTIDLAPGVSHTVTVARAGYAPWTRDVFAEPDKASTLDARLAALLVDVRIQGTPADSEVFVNGEPRGKAPLSLQLTASRHKLELRHEGFNPQTSDLVLAPGIARTIEFALVNPKDVAGNAPKSVVTKGGIKLLLVPGGTYLAGSDRREQGRRPNEGGHKVTLLRPFYMGEREVSNAQFRQFRETHNSGSVGTFSLDLEKQPVVRVTWSEAAEFCNWLSQQEGLPAAYKAGDGGDFTLVTPVNNGYRLPTEGEWEYVARAAATGKPLKYPWGQDLPVVSGTANLAGAEAVLVVGASLDGHRDEFPTVAPPAVFAPNPMGFYDMAGNVSEWANDRYLSFVPSSPVTDPLGPDDGKNHSYRGSNWRSATTVELRFAWREGASDASDVIGFRVARYVAPE